MVDWKHRAVETQLKLDAERISHRTVKADLEHTIYMLREEAKNRVLCPDPVTGEKCKAFEEIREELNKAKAEISMDDRELLFLSEKCNRLSDERDEAEANVATAERQIDHMAERIQAAELMNVELLEAIRCEREVPEMFEPQWIINSMGELGVRVGSRCFFLYKGRNIEYDNDDSDPTYYRPVGKREFGETCKPSGWKPEGLVPSPNGGLWMLVPGSPNPESEDGWYRDPKNVWHYVKDRHLLCGDALRWASNGTEPVQKLSADSGGHACLSCMVAGIDKLGWDMKGAGK